MGHNRGRDNARKRAKRRKKNERLAIAKQPSREATDRQGKKVETKLGSESDLYPVKYFAARDCAPAPNTLAAALLLSSFRNEDFASFLSCSDTSA
jgi:hypothetical protein